MKRTEARIVALDVVCALTEKLRRMGLTRGENSGAGMVHSEEVASDGSQPYIPEWPHITKGCNLASLEARLEWLQNCLLPNVLEGYKELGTNAVVSLGIQSALLGAISAIQEERVIAK